MRLLVITNDFPPTVGGIENYIYSLVRRWPPDQVVVVTRRERGAETFDARQEFEIIREPAGTLLPTPGLARRLVALVGDRRIDVVHFPSILPLALMGRGLGRPYAVSVHGGEFLLASRIPAVRGVLKAVSRRAAIILPESTFAEGLVRRVVGPAARLAKVTCGVDVQVYAQAQPAPSAPGRPLIITVCRLVARKGPRTLVAAMPAVLRKHPLAHLLVVGGGPDAERLRGMAAGLGIEGSVTLTGPRPWEDIPALLAAADVFALPTRSRFLGTETEGLPLVYVEAAAASLPLVGSDVGGVCDAVRPGESGLLVDGSSPAETAEAIVRLLDDPDLARRLGEGARRMVGAEFDWDVQYGLYRKAMAGIA